MGYSVDAGGPPRPGIPRERSVSPSEPSGTLPEPQRHPELLSRSGIRTPTAVFGTAVPARGLSGLVRRAAYRTPEHRSARWALLRAADRLDVLEHRAETGWWVVPAAAALVLGYVAASRLARR